MPRNDIATDSTTTLRELTGDDATATFENDPRFVESNPAATGSSENIEVQRDTDDTEDSDEEVEDAEEEEDLDTEEDEVIEEDEDEDEEDDEDAEDDADEVAAASVLRCDSLCGHEDGREDSVRSHLLAKLDDSEDDDDDEGDVDSGVDEDALDDDDLDTDQVAAAAWCMLPSVAVIYA